MVIYTRIPGKKSNKKIVLYRTFVYRIGEINIIISDLFNLCGIADNITIHSETTYVYYY